MVETVILGKKVILKKMMSGPDPDSMPVYCLGLQDPNPSFRCDSISRMGVGV